MQDAKDDSVRIPKWAITIIFLMISNIIVAGFSAGRIVARLDAMEKNQSGFSIRLDRFEDRLERFGR